LLAKLFSKPANLLVLDEPTNDLDVETLELLEEVLLNFPGTVLIVSHDRAFLDNVVTSTLVFEGQGKVREYVGGYQDWLRQGGSIRLLGVTEQRTGNKMPVAEAVSSAPAPVAVASKPGESSKKKLSYKLQRELEALPAQIESVEKQLAEVQAQIGQPSFYQQPAAQTQAILARLQALQSELDALLERWTELEA
jgi:ATP-binding cassette subfamily F protein uup